MSDNPLLLSVLDLVTGDRVSFAAASANTIWPADSSRIIPFKTRLSSKSTEYPKYLGSTSPIRIQHDIQ